MHGFPIVYVHTCVVVSGLFMCIFPIVYVHICVVVSVLFLCIHSVGARVMAARRPAAPYRCAHRPPPPPHLAVLAAVFHTKHQQQNTITLTRTITTIN